ncbi:uncharacterized protein trdc [Danio rerio]|uniref:Uncharacterized protein trdc n=1 Tax=Danio rerio TaxID=7955 RepID=A0AC45FQJ1_DANRE|nr:uncharacterized protein LOC110438073 [Danio rerio]|eukprot:XP_021323330.1 uncharacterized protein LOC110438073 [Danio rerio]
MKCADPLTFGAPIRLTVNPKETVNSPPAFLSVLSPIKGHGSDICVAAGFFPQQKTMILTSEDGNTVNQETSNAVLSLSSKNYYYVGSSEKKIQECVMDGKTAKADKIDKPSGNPVEDNPKKTATLECHTNTTTPPSTNNDDPKTNSMTLLVIGLRILLAKCVAVNVMLSIKAFLF